MLNSTISIAGGRVGGNHHRNSSSNHASLMAQQAIAKTQLLITEIVRNCQASKNIHKTFTSSVRTTTTTNSSTHSSSSSANANATRAIRIKKLLGDLENDTERIALDNIFNESASSNNAEIALSALTTSVNPTHTTPLFPISLPLLPIQSPQAGNSSMQFQQHQQQQLQGRGPEPVHGLHQSHIHQDPFMQQLQAGFLQQQQNQILNQPAFPVNSISTPSSFNSQMNGGMLGIPLNLNYSSANQSNQSLCLPQSNSSTATLNNDDSTLGNNNNGKSHKESLILVTLPNLARDHQKAMPVLPMSGMPMEEWLMDFLSIVVSDPDFMMMPDGSFGGSEAFKKLNIEPSSSSPLRPSVSTSASSAQPALPNSENENADKSPEGPLAGANVHSNSRQSRKIRDRAQEVGSSEGFEVETFRYLISSLLDTNSNRLRKTPLFNSFYDFLRRKAVDLKINKLSFMKADVMDYIKETMYIASFAQNKVIRTAGYRCVEVSAYFAKDNNSPSSASSSSATPAVQTGTWHFRKYSPCLAAKPTPVIPGTHYRFTPIPCHPLHIVPKHYALIIAPHTPGDAPNVPTWMRVHNGSFVGLVPKGYKGGAKLSFILRYEDPVWEGATIEISGDYLLFVAGPIAAPVVAIPEVPELPKKRKKKTKKERDEESSKFQRLDDEIADDGIDLLLEGAEEEE